MKIFYFLLKVLRAAIIIPFVLLLAIPSLMYGLIAWDFPPPKEFMGGILEAIWPEDPS